MKTTSLKEDEQAVTVALSLQNNQIHMIARLAYPFSKLDTINYLLRGYNKYLKMHGEIRVAIDMDKYESDAAWDGLKGYVTNTTMDDEELLAHYGQPRQIEKAFCMSKTDLRKAF
ncbi:hypothetical protein AAEX37_01170 [Oligella sp. MSHR50489EDL]